MYIYDVLQKCATFLDHPLDILLQVTLRYLLSMQADFNNKLFTSGEQNRYFGVTVPNCYFPAIIRYFLSVTYYPLLFVIIIA